MGGTSLSLTVNEILEALDQGVLDCTISDLPVLRDLSLIEAVTDINLDVPGGLYAAANATSFNADVWRSLTEGQRRAVMRASAAITADSAMTGLENERGGRELAEEKGVDFHRADDGLLEATQSFVREDLDAMVDYYAERHGVERGDEMLATFRELLERWMALVDGVEDRETLEALYWEEIFSRVDVNQHGM